MWMVYYVDGGLVKVKVWHLGGRLSGKRQDLLPDGRADWPIDAFGAR